MMSSLNEYSIIITPVPLEIQQTRQNKNIINLKFLMDGKV